MSTIALILLAWQLLGNNQHTQQNPSSHSQIGLESFLSDDTKNMLNCVNKLSSAQCSQEDKTSAIFEMMANPALMSLASNIFGGQRQNGAENATASDTTVHNQPAQDEHVNDEGYRFETPSAASQEFFRPIDNIADAEVKHKLYWFYDHWYVK